MRLHLLINLIGILILGAVVAEAQTNRRPSSATPPEVDRNFSTAAFAEVVLKRTEFEADLEALLVDYTDDFPKVKELRFGLLRTESEIERLKGMKPGERDRATSALGKLMVRKVESEIELWKLQQAYADGHPEVRRAKKRVEIFEKAIKEILG